MRIKILALTAAVLVLASAQLASSNDHMYSHGVMQHKIHASHNTGFVKPGAAVALSHDYDGKTRLGELETVSVTLSHIYQDGVLSVGLLSAPDVQISAFTPMKNISVYQGSTLDIPIQFSGIKHGRFTLSLEIVYKSPDGQESRRVLSVPVNIGDDIFKKTDVDISSDAESNKAKSSGLIGLAATEVIN